MLKGDNHMAIPLTTHGFLIGVEIEPGVQIESLMNKLVDSLSFVEGVGRVDAEHIGEVGDYKSLEEEVLDSLMVQDITVKES